MATDHLIDWSSEDNVVLLNPRTPEDERKRLLCGLQSMESLRGHFWMATSGSTGKIKWTALSKEAVIVSARAVNKHLTSDRHDIWLNVLPSFHVGGLGIWCRASLSGAKVVPLEGKWQPLRFVAECTKGDATLSSLVPAQVFDLVSHGLRPPKTLRAIIVGGGALNPIVYRQALDLGWPLLKSYGMTECASQIATTALESWKQLDLPLLYPLDHVQLDISAEGFLKIKSPALLTGYAIASGESYTFIDPKVDGWFLTEDSAVVESGAIRSIRRREHFVKIGGESVDLLRLEMILDEERRHSPLMTDGALVPVVDERLGHVIHLAAVGDADDCVGRFNARVFPYERIRQVHLVSTIPRSVLNKVLHQQLAEMCD